MPTTVTKPPVLDETGQNILTQLRRIADAKESNLMGYGGAVLFADLPSPTTSNLGLFYLVQDAFTTTSDFVIGPGVSEPAGKYWAVINIGTNAAPVCKYDEMGSLIDLSAKQDKVMTNPVIVHGVSQTQVEGAISAINAGTGSLANLTTTDKTNLVAAINEAASTGGGGTVDQTYDPTSTNAQSGTAVAGAVADLYGSGDTAETTLADNDYVPFYDTSATAKRKSTWSNIKSVLKNYFDGYYSTTKTSEPAASGGTDLSLVTTGEKNTWNNKISDNPSFSQASSRANIASGESFSTILGKIMKYFADLKDLAYIAKDGSSSTKYLKGDGTWDTPVGTTYGVVSKTANGLAPQLPNETTTTKYLRQDGSWQVPPNTWNANALNTAGYVAAPTSSNANMVWKCDGSGNPAWRGDSNTVPAAYCDTGAGTAAKTASCSGYTLTSNTYLHVIVVNANTAQSALTLNVNGKGAKPIYINGSASSSSNYTLPAGSYIVFYNGTNYYFRTDGALTTEGVYNINPSYGSYNINSQMPTTRRITKVVTAGSDGVGVWDDTTSESGWWQSDYFKFPASANSKNIDVSFKFDPEYGQNEVVALTGYILDTSTGKLCLRFGSAVTNAQLIAVDITYTPTYS